MNSRERFFEWEHHLPLLTGIVVAAVAVYIPFDPGTFAADVPEIVVPLCVSVGLLLTTSHLRKREIESGQLRRIVTFGWIGGVSAAAVAGWWITLHAVRELPIGGLGDQIVTLLSLGIGGGVFVGTYTAHQLDFDPQPVRERVVAEIAWTKQPSPDPIRGAIVDEIAQIDDVEPHELLPLYDQIDFDAVAALHAADDCQWQLLFFTDDYEIRVSSQGTVTIYDIDSPYVGAARRGG